MKILIAGATGAVGQPLVDHLIYYGHEVYGLTKSVVKATNLAARGAKALLVDVLDPDATKRAFSQVQPQIVIDMLTSLPQTYTPESMKRAAEGDARLRKEGGEHLMQAAIETQAERYIVQSSAFWYAPGEGLADEDEPFALEASPGIAAGCKLYSEIEQRVLQTDAIQGIALRFGFFYGQRTWFNPDGDVASQVRNKQFPIIGKGEGIWNFVHVEDAALAAASALYCPPGAYNIVNSRPSSMHDWLPAFARTIRAPYPPQITEEEAAKTRGPDAVYYATKLRGATHAKAQKLLNFSPRPFDWFA